MELSRRALLSFRRSAAPASAPGYWIHLARPAMACTFEITLPSELDQHIGDGQAALGTIDGLEDQLSIFRDTSDLSALNREAHTHAVPVEARLFDLLVRCQELHVATAGTFDITSTPLSRIWGFLRREGRIPTTDELGEAKSRVGMAHVRLDREARTVQLARPGMALNLGSIGKGYALDRAASTLSRAGAGTALLTAGSSSVVALGAGPDGAGFMVGLRDPFDQAKRLGTVRLRRAALGVSGAGEQFFVADGRRYGHIIDPRTGWPVEGMAQAAVIAPEGALADALATAFFVGGPALAQSYVAAHPEVTALLIPTPLNGKPMKPMVIGRASPWSFTRAH